MAFQSAVIIDWQVFVTLSLIAGNYGICSVLVFFANLFFVYFGNTVSSWEQKPVIYFLFENSTFCFSTTVTAGWHSKVISISLQSKIPLLRLACKISKSRTKINLHDLSLKETLKSNKDYNKNSSDLHIRQIQSLTWIYMYICTQRSI